MKRITAFLCTLLLIVGCLTGCSQTAATTAAATEPAAATEAPAETTPAADEPQDASQPAETAAAAAADKTADLVVIGAGGAGLVAALQAADNGAAAYIHTPCRSSLSLPAH